MRQLWGAVVGGSGPVMGGRHTSLTLLPAGVEASVSVDKLTDGIETTTTVARVHDAILQRDIKNSIKYITRS